MFSFMFSFIICLSLSTIIISVVDHIPAAEMVRDAESDGDGEEENETD